MRNYLILFVASFVVLLAGCQKDNPGPDPTQLVYGPIQRNAGDLIGIQSHISNANSALDKNNVPTAKTELAGASTQATDGLSQDQQALAGLGKVETYIQKQTATEQKQAATITKLDKAWIGPQLKKWLWIGGILTALGLIAYGYASWGPAGVLATAATWVGHAAFAFIPVLIKWVVGFAHWLFTMLSDLIHKTNTTTTVVTVPKPVSAPTPSSTPPATLTPTIAPALAVKTTITTTGPVKTVVVEPNSGSPTG